jgi:hypothetical protein
MRATIKKCPLLLHYPIAADYGAKAELILSAKRASPTPPAALGAAGHYRLLTGNNNDLPIADRF